MEDESKSKKQLIVELMEYRRRIEKLEASGPSHKKTDENVDRFSHRKNHEDADRYVLRENQEILEYLKRSRLFSHLPKRILEQLLPLSHLADYPSGSEILKEGAINTEVFFMIQGSVEVYAGGNKIAELRRKGDIFGEMSIISNKPCSASIIAKTPVKVFSINAKYIGDYTDIETNELDNVFYRLFAMILTEKLSLTNKKAQQYEATHKNLLIEIDERNFVEKELQKAKYTLEQRVEERTSELKAANERLQREIEVREQAEEKRLNLEKQLQQSQKMQAIGTLTGGITHEFNNILQIMIGYADGIYKKISEESLRENIQEVIKAGQRGKELIKQLLNFSHPKESEFKSLHITPIVKDSIKMMHSTLPRSIEIRENLNAECETIFGDSFQIHQVMVNLFNNASYALNYGPGIIEIGLEQITLDSDSITLPALKTGKYIRLIFKDNGCGMSPEVKERIFEPFYTTKEIGQGTGLGLSVVYGIIQKHQGVINVISETEKGSTFEIYFPVVEGRTSVQTPKKENAFRKGEERILFVDDELPIASLYKEFLTSCGYTVTISNNGMEAYEIFCESPDNFDMVVTDKGMPKMDGIQLAQNLLKVRPDLPVILLTGYGDLIVNEKIRKVGFRKILTKPVDFNEMSDALRHILDGIL